MIADKVKGYADLARPQNAAAGVLGFSIGYFFNNHPAAISSFLAGTGIILLLHSAVTIQNDIQDIEIDKTNNRKTIFINGTVNKFSLENIVLLLISLTLLIGLASPNHRLSFLFIGLLILFSWMYNMPPFYFSRRPLLSILAMGVCYGALPVVYGYTTGGGRSVVVILGLGLIWLTVRISSSIMKDYKDAAGDRKHGKHTFYLEYGSKITAWISVLFSAAAYLAAITTLIFKFGWGWPTVLVAIITMIAARNVYTRIGLLKIHDTGRMAGIFSRSFYYQNQFDLAVLLCLIAF